eukprot:365270-Chlamydomonas_euryale.AAC.11
MLAYVHAPHGRNLGLAHGGRLARAPIHACIHVLLEHALESAQQRCLTHASMRRCAYPRGEPMPKWLSGFQGSNPLTCDSTLCSSISCPLLSISLASSSTA